MPGRTDQDEASYRIAVCANTELLTQEPQKEKKPRIVVWTEYELRRLHVDMLRYEG